MRWQQVYEQGACQGIDPDEFFPDDADEMPKQIAAACAVCPVREQCLRMAVEEDLRFGIFGGVTPHRRALDRRENGRTVCGRGHKKADHSYLTSQGRVGCRRCDVLVRRSKHLPYTAEELASMRHETCRQGHPWKETLRVTASGKKTCAKCRRNAKDRDRAKARGGDQMCLQGHKIVGDNVVVYANGTRRCKTCEGSRRRSRALL